MYAIMFHVLRSITKKAFGVSSPLDNGLSFKIHDWKRRLNTHVLFEWVMPREMFDWSYILWIMVRLRQLNDVQCVFDIWYNGNRLSIGNINGFVDLRSSLYQNKPSRYNLITYLNEVAINIICYFYHLIFYICIFLANIL